MKLKRNRYLTNAEVVAEMMNFSEVGAIKQAFILMAIEDYSKRVIASKAVWDNGFISQEAWKKAAQECKDALDEHLGKSQRNADAVTEPAENEGV